MNASACNKRTTAYVVFRKSYPQTIIIIIIKCGLMLDEMYFLCSTDNALPPPPMDWRQTTAQFIANGNEQWQRWRYRCSTSGYVKNRKRMEQRQTKQKKKKYGKERTRERGYNLVLEMLHESHTHTRGCALSFLLSPCGIVALCNVRIDHFHYYCYYYSKRVKNQSNRPRYGLTCCGICGESTRCCCSSDRILARIGGVCGA